MSRLEAVYQHPDGNERKVVRWDHDGPCDWPDCDETGTHRHIRQSGGSGGGCHLLLWGDDLPNDFLVVVEGERAAVALMDKMHNTSFTPVSWMGGAGAEKNARWDAVKGRCVIMWPDNDEAGRSAMNLAARKARRVGARKVVVIHTEGEDGRDTVDMSKNEIRESLLLALRRIDPESSLILPKTRPEMVLNRISELNWNSEVYVVGGTVRDMILNQSLTDIDLVVQGSSHELAETVAALVGGSVVPVGGDHDVTRVAMNGKIVVDIAGFEGTIQEDLARRDFTANALALPLQHWPNKESIIGDKVDLYGRWLRPVNEDIFKVDPVRMLRALRFQHQYRLTFDDTLPRMISEHASSLMNAPIEKVMEEFQKILALPSAFHSIKAMQRFGLLDQIFPELLLCEGVAQPPKYHVFDVMEHQLQTFFHTEFLIKGSYMGSQDFTAYFDEEVGDNQTRGIMLKLAALLHDIGKPSTVSVDDGDIHFYDHEKIGARMIYERMRKLKVAKSNAKIIANVVRYHMRPYSLTLGATQRAIHHFCRAAGEDVIDILWLGMADKMAHRQQPDPWWNDYVVGIDRVLELKDQPANSPARKCSFVDGNDLMKELGIDRGPFVGDILAVLCEAEACGEIEDREGALTLARKVRETQ